MIDVPGVDAPVNAALTASNNSAEAEELGATEEPGIAALKALFVQYGLGGWCVDVCRGLGVDGVEDLSFVTIEDVDKLPGKLPDNLKDQLFGARLRKLLALLGLQRPATGQQSTGGTSGGATRHADSAGQQQVFLGYRVASDADLVERLHDKLKAEGVNVWWDKRCLPAGQPWEQGFADGLNSSTIFVPVLSKAALAPCAKLTAASACDNVVFEHQLALELYLRGDLRAIFPVLVGEVEHNPTLGDIHGDFFKDGGMPACEGDVVVAAVEGKLVEHLGRLGKGVPMLPASDRTVKATLAAITRNQGVKLFGVRSDTVDNAVAAIKRLATSSSVTTT